MLRSPLAVAARLAGVWVPGLLLPGLLLMTLAAVHGGQAADIDPAAAQAVVVYLVRHAEKASAAQPRCTCGRTSPCPAKMSSGSTKGPASRCM